MRKYMIMILCVMLVMVMLAGCKSKEAQKLPDKNATTTPFIFAPLPPFSTVFGVLDYLKIGDYDKAIDSKIYTTKQDAGRSAFALGVLTADGIISVRGHNKTKLNAIAEEMIKISNFLDLDQSILSLADQLKELIANDQWDELEKAMENYKSRVEGTLYQTQQYDQCTMMQAGGWVEGINRISWFIIKNYQKDKTHVLDQKGTLNNLLQNMENISTKSMKEEAYFKTTYENLRKIKLIVDASTDKTYTKEQVQQMADYSQIIKDAYQK